MSMGWGRRLRSGFTAAAVALGALAVGAELALRWCLPPGADLIPFDRSRRILGVDDAREHPWAQGASNVWTAAIIGDSIAMGVGNQKCHRLAFVLEWFLNVGTSAPPARVRLYAKPSATYQQVDQVRRAIEEGASLVVLALSLNDTEDWSNPAELMERRADLRGWTLPAWLQPVARHSRLVGTVARAIERHCRLRQYVAYYRFLYRADYSGLAKFRTSLREIRAVADARGVPVVAMLFPLWITDLRPGRYPFAPMHEEVTSACRQAGIPLLDLWPAMAATVPDRLEAIPLVDAHGSEVAHRIAAEELFYFLLERRLVDTARRPTHVRELERLRAWEKKLRALGQPLESPSASPRGAAQ
ncbi:MAG: hypothetical protein N2652_08755 [Kiritimatiellae bacterium]|nr:hypothetical protein [Kiritimatiellia bacterium]